MLRLTGIDLRRCPFCRRGRMLVIEILPPPILHDPDPPNPDSTLLPRASVTRPARHANARRTSPSATR